MSQKKDLMIPVGRFVLLKQVDVTPKKNSKIIELPKNVKKDPDTQIVEHYIEALGCKVDPEFGLKVGQKVKLHRHFQYVMFKQDEDYTRDNINGKGVIDYEDIILILSQP